MAADNACRAGYVDRALKWFIVLSIKKLRYVKIKSKHKLFTDIEVSYPYSFESFTFFGYH